MPSQQGINNCVVLGNVVNEAQRTKDGSLAFVLGCVERFKASDGAWTDREVQVPILVHGKRGESLRAVVKVGDRILVEGSFDARGDKRWIRASNVVLCGGKKPPAQSSSSAPSVSDDDIPF
jgi:primosomal replication protein N